MEEVVVPVGGGGGGRGSVGGRGGEGDSPTMAALGDGGSNRRLLQAAFSGEQQPSPASLGSVAIRDQNKQEG
ncbi:hypothetical protein L1887_28669 [Cichorium endivia]|nr:hypothetical protein L1887_28669 [Cichorium endivia]